MTNSIMFDRKEKEQQLYKALSEHGLPSTESQQLIKTVLDFVEHNVDRYEQLISSAAFFEAAMMAYNCPDNVEEYRKMLMREGSRRAALHKGLKKP